MRLIIRRYFTCDAPSHRHPLSTPRCIVYTLAFPLSLHNFSGWDAVTPLRSFSRNTLPHFQYLKYMYITTCPLVYLI